jgi:hypothetical protein
VAARTGAQGCAPWTFLRAGSVAGKVGGSGANGFGDFCRNTILSVQNWTRFSAPAELQPGMASVKSHPGWSLLRFHRYTIPLRSKDRGTPSVACPLAGTKVHWTLVCLRLAHAPATFAHPCAAQGSGSHPQLAFESRRSRHNRLFGGLRQKSSNPLYIN